MVTILMMSAKLFTLEFVKTNAFWSKVYDVIISVHDITSTTEFYHVTQSTL